MVNILIAGDIASQNYASKFLINSFCEVTELISSSNYSIVNLETPIGDINTLKPIYKQGPNLLCTEHRLDIIKEIGFKAVTLANNHIYDYGEGGLCSTIQGLKKRGIEYVGAGLDCNEASAILEKTICGKKIGFINCCEQEFSTVTTTHGGANAIDPVKLYYQILERKKDFDYIILLIHGGVEHFQYPTKRMVQIYRFFIDAGADAVINHHQHCPCGYEVYKGKPIYYGLGNFCFDWEGRSKSIWNIGYMVNLNLTGEHYIESKIIPFRQCDDKSMVELLKGDDLELFKKMMTELCESIKSDEVLDAKLAEYNIKNDYLYKKMLEPYSGRLASSLYRRGLLPSTINKDRVLALMDFVVCESHYERVKELLDRLYNEYFHE